MGSLYLNRLNLKERDALMAMLHETQRGKCFICQKTIDVEVQKRNLDIDHVVPTKVGGKDAPSNFALTHATCNRAKQDSNLEVARILHKFTHLRDELASENRGPNLNDVFQLYGGAKHDVDFSLANGKIRYCVDSKGKNQVFELPVYLDKLSGFSYFFTELPISYLHHDDKINPRSIGQNISKLVREFYLKRPQLHVPLGWIELSEGTASKVKIFDGQHKAAAQVLLGVKALPVRVFINPDRDVLLKTNMNAGTVLRQVAFDKSVQRHIGSSLYLDRIQRYKDELNLAEGDFSFSERDLVNYFRGESREVKRYILDSVRDAITHHPDNKLRDFIDFAGRKTERPLSYSNIEKTFYSLFIYQAALDTPLDYRLEEGENPRDLEKSQILELMNIIAEEVFIGRFDSDIGTNRIESRIQKGESLPLDHIRAFRIGKEEILYNWLRYTTQIVKNYYIMQGTLLDEQKLMHRKLPDKLWERIRTFVSNLVDLPIWVNEDLSSTVFGAKQNYDFWHTVFETGKTPQGAAVLAEPLNLMEMMKD
jgi:hypothetical protein